MIVHFLLKDPYHLHTGSFKVFILYINYVKILKNIQAYCKYSNLIYQGHIVLVVTDCFLNLYSRLLVLG